MRIVIYLSILFSSVVIGAQPMVPPAWVFDLDLKAAEIAKLLNKDIVEYHKKLKVHAVSKALGKYCLLANIDPREYRGEAIDLYEACQAQRHEHEKEQHKQRQKRYRENIKTRPQNVVKTCPLSAEIVQDIRAKAETIIGDKEENNRRIAQLVANLRKYCIEENVDPRNYSPAEIYDAYLVRKETKKKASAKARSKRYRTKCSEETQEESCKRRKLATRGEQECTPDFSSVRRIPVRQYQIEILDEIDLNMDSLMQKYFDFGAAKHF